MDKTLVTRNLRAILEDHQRRLFLDLASYVDQQLAESLPSPRLKRTRFDSTETSEVELRDEVSPLRSLADAPTSRPSSNELQSVHTRRSVSYNLAKRVSENENHFSKAPSKSNSLTNHFSCCCHSYLIALVEAWQFEAFFALVIITNSVFIGVTIQLESMDAAGYDKTAVFAIQLAYSSLFTVELFLRIAAVGPRGYFCAAHTAWNWFDTMIVISALYELVTVLVDKRLTSQEEGQSGIASSAGSNLRILRVLRLTRLTRIFRVLRVVRFVRPLQTLVHAIFQTVRALLWASMLLFLINYMFAILFTDVVNSYLSGAEIAMTEGPMLQKFFGTLQSSTLTLFQSISGGLSWAEAVDPLMPMGWLWVYAYCSYVAFSLFAVLNVMTGVFCQSAIKTAERDQEMAVQNLLLDKEKMRYMLRKLFNKLDDTNSGTLTLSDIEKHFDDDEVRALFETLELKATDAWTLFQSIDHNEDFKINLEEFLNGCVELRGFAKAVDLFALRMQVAKVREELKTISHVLSTATLRPPVYTHLSL